MICKTPASGVCGDYDKLFSLHYGAKKCSAVQSPKLPPIPRSQALGQDVLSIQEHLRGMHCCCKSLPG